MMKNFKYLAMAIATLLTISSCSKDNDEQAPKKGKQPVEFQMGLSGTGTRTATDNTASRTTTWSQGDAVGIFVYRAGDTATPVMANAKYVLTGEKWVAAEGSEIYPEEAYDYYAYYPYQEGVTNPAAINVAALANQTKADGTDYGLSDILAAPKTAVAANTAIVPLTFKHMFAMVEVQVKGDLVTQKPTKVMLKGVKLGATLDIMATAPAATVKSDDAATDVEMYYLEKTVDADKAPFSYRAVVPAQTMTAKTSLVSIVAPDAGNKTYTMQHSADVTYDAGKFRQLVVTIGAAKVSLEIPAGNLTINPWEGTPEVPGTGEEVPFITPLMDVVSLPILENIDPHAPASSIKDIDSWYIRRALATDEGSGLVDDVYNGQPVKAIKIVSTGANFGWFKMVAGFYKKNANCDITKKYRVSFAVKKAAGTSTSLNMIIKSVSSSSFFNLCDASGTPTDINVVNATTATDTWSAASAIFSFARTKNTAANSALEEGKITMSDSKEGDGTSLDIRFYANSGGGSVLYITDVKFEEVIEAPVP